MPNANTREVQENQVQANGRAMFVGCQSIGYKVVHHTNRHDVRQERVEPREREMRAHAHTCTHTHTRTYSHGSVT
jgi:hypothetical protein